MHEDKPVGARHGWKRLGTTYPYGTRWLRLRQDRVLHGETEITFTYLDSPGSVAVVPVTGDGQIVLLRQYRYTVDDVFVEIPAGGLHDMEGKSLEEAARTELKQEVGATCRELEYISAFYTTVGQSNQKQHVFLALGVELSGEQELEPTEQIDLYPVPAAEALRMAHAGEMPDGASALSLLLCENRLKEAGYL